MDQPDDYVVYLNPIKGHQIVKLNEIILDSNLVRIEFLDGSGFSTVTSSSIRRLIIYTNQEEVILNCFGFRREIIEIEQDGIVHTRFRFVNNGLTLSLTSIRFKSRDIDNLFNSGLCVGDFTDIHFDLSQYLNETGIDITRFYENHPSVQNVNRLIEKMVQNHIGLNFENILRENINLFIF